MLKKLAVLLFIACPLLASGNHQDYEDSGQAGPQGPAGVQGPQGPRGEDGRDAYQSHLYAGADIRWYDAKRWMFTTGYRHDVLHGGHVGEAVVGFKFGPSYEEREIEQLTKKIAILEDYILLRLPPEQKPVSAVIRGSR